MRAMEYAKLLLEMKRGPAGQKTVLMILEALTVSLSENQLAQQVIAEAAA